MQAVIVQVIIMLHAAFGCMFLLMNWQHPAKFSRLIAQSWLLEAFRAGIVYAELDRTGGFSHWHSLSDCLNLVATWWLLAGCADLVGARLPAKLGKFYIGIGSGVILALRYLAPPALESAGVAADQAIRWSLLVELVLIFTTVTIARVTILVWFIGLWRRTRRPGTLPAIVFGVPYIAFGLAVPWQFYFGYYPEWIYLGWTLRVLGFSLGLVLLLSDRQLVALRASEARVRRFIESNIQGVLICNFRGQISDANDAFLRIIGYTRADLLAGRINWQKLTPPEWAELDRRVIDELRTRGLCMPWEKEYFHKDGTRVPVLVGVAMLDDQRSEESEALAFVLDLSDRKKAENRIRHLANFPELNPNPVLEFAADGSLLYQNPAAEEMLRRLGQDRIEKMLPAEAGQVVTQCLSTGQPRLRLVTKHGKHTLSWSFYPIRQQQTVHCYIGDVTERTLLEAQLRQSQKMEAVGQLAGGVAHDFNNLLTAIIGHLGLLQNGPALPPEAQDSLAEIAKAAGRATNLTNQLLAFSRLQVSSIQPLDLNEVVTNLGKMLRRLLGEDIAMHLDLAPGQLVFNGDAGMMEQVVLNLVVNARDAMPAGGSLRIATNSERRPGREANVSAEVASWLCLSVSDTGTGIPPEILPKIFEPFFTTKEVGKGTGLGLATVFGIVQQHHGWIDVESAGVGHDLPHLPAAAACDPQRTFRASASAGCLRPW
jgi:PAS domain S-box-containing protein